MDGFPITPCRRLPGRHWTEASTPKEENWREGMSRRASQDVELCPPQYGVWVFSGLVTCHLSHEASGVSRSAALELALARDVVDREHCSSC